MKEKQQAISLFMLKFLKVVNKINELEKRAYDFGVGEKLFPSEIHTLQAIGNNSCINVSSLAREQGVSRAAVSQMVAKLAKRGFIKKLKSLENSKEVLLVLTEKGKAAFDGHEKFHAEMYADFMLFMDGVPRQEIELVKGLLEKIDFYLDRYAG